MLEPSTIPSVGITKLGTAPALEPYSHQVAGHAALCKFNDKTICKPLNATERDFYELVARQGPLAPFTADYLGVVNVTASSSPRKPAAVVSPANGDGQVPSHAHSPASLAGPAEVDAVPSAAAGPATHLSFGSTGSSAPTGSEVADMADLAEGEEYTLTLQPFRIPDSPSVLVPRWRVAPAGTGRSTPPPPPPPPLALPAPSSSGAAAAIAGRPPRPAAPAAADRVERPLTPGGSVPTKAARASSRLQLAPYGARPPIQSNPWSLHCQRIEKLKHGTRRVNQFVLLEDLTYRFRRPCILDLKMGTRQHGPDATPAKIASQTAKCQATTSASLGVRLCGMQVFRADAGTFEYRDKYFGRSLTRETFKESIRDFLSNGHTILTHLIPAFVARLSKLYQVIQSLPHLRFYGSSLLLLYDGKDDLDYLRDVDVRMIDFANTCRVEPAEAAAAAAGSPAWAEADDGYLQGLRSLIAILEDILTNAPVTASSSDDPPHPGTSPSSSSDSA